MPGVDVSHQGRSDVDHERGPSSRGERRGPDEVQLVEEHLHGCGECRRELEALRPVVDSFVAWPTDVLRPSPSAWSRLAQRIADEAGDEPLAPAREAGTEAEW